MALPDVGFLQLPLPPAPDAVLRSFADLPPDPYSGNARLRRFSQYRVRHDDTRWVPQRLPARPFIQARRYNTLVGGVARKFEPIVVEWNELTHLLASALALDTHTDWHANVHQVRVVASASKPGVVVPEGRHQDGHKYACLAVLRRESIQGGVTSLWDEAGIELFRGIIEESTAIVFDDERLWHDTSAVHTDTEHGMRDMFIVVFNRWSNRRYGDAHDRIAGESP